MKPTKWKGFTVQIFISFGTNHAHRYAGKTLDCDSIAVMDSPDEISVRKFCRDQFENKYSTTYLTPPDPDLFPRGFIDIGSVPPQHIEKKDPNGKNDH